MILGCRIGHSRPVSVIKIVEAAAKTLVEDGGTTQSKAVVRAERKPSSVDGTGLRRGVKLELVVGSDILK